MTLPIEPSSFKIGIMTDTFGGLFKTRGLLWLGALGAAMAGLFVRISLISDVSQLRLYVALYLAIFAVYTAAIFVGLRIPDSRRALFLLIGFGILFRLILLPVKPVISTDYYRYIWDGRVASAGINPYEHPPSDKHLAHLRDGNWRRINYRDVSTPYPPTSQVIFAASHRLFNGWFYGLKIVLLLFDLVAMALILSLLRVMDLPRRTIILYAWSPLVVTEFAGLGHQDIIGIALLLAGLHLLVVRQSLLSGVLTAAAGLVKPYALALVPVFLRAGGARLLGTVLAASVLLYLPFMGAGTGLLSGSLAYAQDWRRNDSLFTVIDMIFAAFTERHEFAAKLGGLMIVAATATGLSLRRIRSQTDLMRRVFVLLALIFLLSPTVYPWYVAWTVPFLCFMPSPGWILLTGTIGLQYLLDANNQPGWIRMVEYIPVYAALAAGFFLPTVSSTVESRKTRRSAKDAKGCN